MMNVPSVLQHFLNQLRAVVPSIPENNPPPCLLSTQPACLALAMTLFSLSGKKAAGSEGQSHLIITPTQEEAEELYEDLQFFYLIQSRELGHELKHGSRLLIKKGMNMAQSIWKIWLTSCLPILNCGLRPGELFNKVCFSGG